jgi:hypothetical protein
MWIFCHLSARFCPVYGDMITTETMHTAERNDADLVAESLEGRREAETGRNRPRLCS